MYREEGRVVLCGANAYERKFYLNPLFQGLPDRVKDELKILCVLYTAEIGGILTLEYEPDGILELVTRCSDGDLAYDEIGAGLKISEIRREKQELLESMELYYKLVLQKKQKTGEDGSQGGNHATGN